jgi:Flp pilus assembly pilin Flp
MPEAKHMRRKPWNCCGSLYALVLREEAQELIEYALVFTVIALAATAGMQSAASGVSAIFITIAATLASATA